MLELDSGTTTIGSKDGPAIIRSTETMIAGRSAILLRYVSTRTESRYAALHRLGELGREIGDRRGPDPYPRPSGPAPSLQELRRRRGEIERLAVHHGFLPVLVRWTKIVALWPALSA